MTAHVLPASEGVRLEPRERAPAWRTLAGEQALVAGAQALAGLGNLVFSLVLVHLLAPAQFAPLAAFLGLYLLVHAPALSLSASSAQRPGWALARLPRLSALGLGGAAAVAACTPLLAPALGLPVALLLALAAALPGAPALALARGSLYGEGRHRRAVASLLAEPALRVAAGLPLALALGPAGAAGAVVLAGYGALGVALWGRRAEAPGAVAPSVPWTTIAAFLALAVVQTQDLLWANATLPATEAARFALLSTVGGIAIFASATVPLVLLPRAVRGETGALGAALALAAALGLGSVLAVAAAPGALVDLFGARYADAAPLFARYLLAMALLGLARVLVAHRIANDARAAAVLPAGAAVLQAALLVAFGDSAAAIADCTLAACAALAMVAGVAAAGGHRLRALRAAVIDLPSTWRVPASRTGALRRTLRRREVLTVAGLTLLALVPRLLIERGLWLDEAISVEQARMSLPDMLDALRTGDVHPPLHHLLLWVTVRIAGAGETAVRLPSLIAGTLLVPALYFAGRELYHRHRVGLLAALVGALSPLAVWYSQEARMYSLFMLLALLAVWMQVRVVRRGRPVDWLLYTLASAALLWTQYFGLLQVLVQQGAFAGVFVYRWRSGVPVGRALIGWAVSALTIVLLCLPLAGLASDQLHAYLDRRAATPSSVGSSVAPSLEQLSIYAGIANAVWTVIGYHSDHTMLLLGALWPLAMLGSLFMLGRGWSATTALVTAAALVPIIALFGLGLLKRDLFEVRYFAGAVPLIALLIGRLLASFKPRSVTGAIAGAAVGVMLVAGLTDQQLNRTNPRFYDFEGATARILGEARPGDTVIYSPSFLEPIAEYYLPRQDTRSIARADEALRDVRGRVFVIASFLDRPNVAARTGAVISEIERRGRVLDARFDEPQVKVWVYR
jgi:Dolichyl-phosphate-mannose-protein mannosyltransferase